MATKKISAHFYWHNCQCERQVPIERSGANLYITPAMIQAGVSGGGYTQGARVFNNSTQSLAAATVVYSDYDTEDYDTDTIHSAVTNTTRLTCKTAGKYLIGGSGRIGGATAGTALTIRIRLNGALLVALDQRPAIGTNDYLSTSTVMDLAINDYLEMAFSAAAGAAMIIDSQAYYTPVLVDSADRLNDNHGRKPYP
jgi:hypothetical protein